MNFLVKRLGLAAFLGGLIGSGTIAPAFANTPRFIQSSSAAIPLQLAQAGWQSFSPPEAGFTVQMPNRPERTVRSIPQEQGGQQYQYVAQTGDGFYMVMFQRFPQDISGLLSPEDINSAFDKGVSTFIDGTQARLISQRSISLAGNPGREFEFNLMGFNGKGRLFLAGSELYLLIGASQQSADRDRFLNSFQLQ